MSDLAWVDIASSAKLTAGLSLWLDGD